METLVLDGKKYIKASKAAKTAGYTSDYVGQLCRSGKIDAHLIGRSWYVDPEQLSGHRVESKRNARTKAREQVRKVLAEEKDSFEKAYEKKAIKYEHDEGELIPEIVKIPITSGEIKKLPKIEAKTLPVEKYSVENEGNEVKMSGSIAITDASEESIDDDATILTPKILKNVPKYRGPQPKGEDTQKNPTFMEKIEFKEAENSPETLDDDVSSDVTIINTQTKTSSLPVAIVLLVLLVLALSPLFISAQLDYKNQRVDTTFQFVSNIKYLEY